MAGPAVFATGVLVAARSDLDAAIGAMGVLLAIGLFVYIFRSFGDPDLPL